MKRKNDDYTIEIEEPFNFLNIPEEFINVIINDLLCELLSESERREGTSNGRSEK